MHGLSYQQARNNTSKVGQVSINLEPCFATRTFSQTSPLSTVWTLKIKPSHVFVQVYVAEPGYMLSRGLVPKGAIITQLAGVATPDVAAFVRQLARVKHGQRVPLQYSIFNERHRQKTAILHIDYRWCVQQHLKHIER